MSSPVAFQATYSDWRLIKSRKVVQVVLEIPIEAANAAYHVLGGMPDPSKSVWCGVARLNANGDGTASPSGGEAVTPAGGGLPARPERKLSQQAGTCCSDPRFQKWLGAVDRDEAANIVRQRCGVARRSEIISGTPAGELWSRMYVRFRIWCDVPELAES